MLLPVDDHSGDLLVHEYENGDEQRWDGGRQVDPPGVPPERRDQPASLGIGGLERQEEEEEEESTLRETLFIQLVDRTGRNQFLISHL